MIDPELQPYLAMWTAAWATLPPRADIQDRRALLEKLASDHRKNLPDGIETSIDYARHNGRAVRVRLFRASGAAAAPCLVYMHGGAFMQGSPETHDAIAIQLVAQAGYTVISVDYALAPEEPYPAAVHDCEAVLRWTLANAGPLRIRADAIVVGGDSAGANLAAVMALNFRGTSLKLKGQLLFYPPVDTDLSRPSFRENAAGPIIRTADMAHNWSLYCPNPADLRSPFVAPLRAPDHAGLPPAYVAVAEHDPLRDDGLAYAARLSQAGVPVELHRGAGLIHGYLRAMDYAQSVRDAFGMACTWLRRRAADSTMAADD